MMLLSTGNEDMIANNPPIVFDNSGEGPFRTQLDSLDEVDAVGVLLSSGHVPSLLWRLGIDNPNRYLDQMDSKVDSKLCMSRKIRENCIGRGASVNAMNRFRPVQVPQDGTSCIWQSQATMDPSESSLVECRFP